MYIITIQGVYSDVLHEVVDYKTTTSYHCCICVNSDSIAYMLYYMVGVSLLWWSTLRMLIRIVRKGTNYPSMVCWANGSFWVPVQSRSQNPHRQRRGDNLLGPISQEWKYGYFGYIGDVENITYFNLFLSLLHQHLLLLVSVACTVAPSSVCQHVGWCGHADCTTTYCLHTLHCTDMLMLPSTISAVYQCWHVP